LKNVVSWTIVGVFEFPVITLVKTLLLALVFVESFVKLLALRAKTVALLDNGFLVFFVFQFASLEPFYECSSSLKASLIILYNHFGATKSLSQYQSLIVNLSLVPIVLEKCLINACMGRHCSGKCRARIISPPRESATLLGEKNVTRRTQ
jgi:hypothetical protein